MMMAKTLYWPALCRSGQRRYQMHVLSYIYIYRGRGGGGVREFEINSSQTSLHLGVKYSISRCLVLRKA